MTTIDKPAHKSLIAWTNKTLGEDPEFDGEAARVKFSFKAGGRYPLECLFQAQEPVSIVTISGHAYLAIPSEKADQVTEYCSENGGEGGTFSVIEGSLVFVHSRSAETDDGDGSLCGEMVSRANDAVSSVAEGVLAILKP